MGWHVLSHVGELRSTQGHEFFRDESESRAMACCVGSLCLPVGDIGCTDVVWGGFDEGKRTEVLVFGRELVDIIVGDIVLYILLLHVLRVSSGSNNQTPFRLDTPECYKLEQMVICAATSNGLFSVHDRLIH